MLHSPRIRCETPRLSLDPHSSAPSYRHKLAKTLGQTPAAESPPAGRTPHTSKPYVEIGGVWAPHTFWVANVGFESCRLRAFARLAWIPVNFGHLLMELQ